MIKLLLFVSMFYYCPEYMLCLISVQGNYSTNLGPLEVILINIKLLIFSLLVMFIGWHSEDFQNPGLVIDWSLGSN